MRIFKIVTPIIVLAVCGMADGPARADDLDVVRHTVPAAAIDPSLIVHVGDGKYCSKPILNTCEGLDVSGGGGGQFGAYNDPTPAEKQANIEAHWTKAPPSPPSPPTSGL